MLTRPLIPVLSDNRALPALSGWKARSTWLILIAGAVTLYNLMGIDLLSLLGQLGLGGTAEEIIATGEQVQSAWQVLAPLVLGIWT